MTRTELLCLVAIWATIWCSPAIAEHDHDSSKRIVYHNQFAVVIPAGKETANEVASKYGFNNLGQIGSLKHHYLFEHKHVHKRSADPAHDHHQNLDTDHRVSVAIRNGNGSGVLFQVRQGTKSLHS
ncbi:neuroendocrine convertase 1-like isoform X2 [Portunus trituberculatus]|uniref:neuroendocrine convertase 1-like isoform X2 n=1 Tax=Portunus trituberculatus TaxID=210409 RepID=UPI001E1CBC6C|nr:neuroendocrine convertase 1-like isoform X2 [Portunus trituberculatus]